MIIVSTAFCRVHVAVIVTSSQLLSMKGRFCCFANFIFISGGSITVGKDFITDPPFAIEEITGKSRVPGRKIPNW